MGSDSYKRAEMPSGTAAVLEKRTLETSNVNLLTVLKTGQKVLDVGCGSGSITHGIGNYVGEHGLVRGVDRNRELIDLAIAKYGPIKNIGFSCTDVLNYNPDIQFDVVTTARTLQWIANPEIVIRKMISLLAPKGIFCVLDYNHTLIRWNPAPPESMRYFYRKFLQWRSDTGMDNEIGDHMAELLTMQNMRIIGVDDQSEHSERGKPGFETHIGIWSQVARLRGKQLVEDEYITEQERLSAIADYAHWAEKEAQSMTLYLKATHASLNT